MERVVTAIIVRRDDNNTKYLLVSSNKDFGKFTGYYYPPGGHVEEGEDDINCIQRELKEELNMIITDAKNIAETPGDVSNQITAWYNCTVESYEFDINSKELKDANYFTIDEMKILKIWPATKTFFEKYLKV